MLNIHTVAALLEVVEGAETGMSVLHLPINKHVSHAMS